MYNKTNIERGKIKNRKTKRGTILTNKATRKEKGI